VSGLALHAQHQVCDLRSYGYYCDNLAAVVAAPAVAGVHTTPFGAAELAEVSGLALHAQHQVCDLRSYDDYCDCKDIVGLRWYQ